jgi:hypothetical protein
VRVALRPAVAADLPHVIGVPLPFRIRAITAHIGDRVLGVGGLGYLPNGIVGAFMALHPDFRNYPVAMHRAGIAGMALIRESGEPRVVAIADELVAPARRWLEHFGFKAATVDGVTAYVWQAR